MGYSWVTPDEEQKNVVVNQNPEAMTWAMQKNHIKVMFPG